MATDFETVRAAIPRTMRVADDDRRLHLEAHPEGVAALEALDRIESLHKSLIAAIPRLYALKSCPLSWGEMEIEFYNELLAAGESEEQAMRVAALAFP